MQGKAFGEGRASVPRGVGVLALAPLGQASLNRGVAAARVTDGVLAVTLSGTSGAGPAPLTVRLRGRTVGRMLAAPGASVPIPLPSVAPGWWVGDVALDPDELRSDDRRAFVWRGGPPPGVRGEPPPRPFVAAALAAVEPGKRARGGC